MDSLLLKRVLATGPLMEQMSRQLNLAGTRLLFAIARPINAPGYLSDLVGVMLGWVGIQRSVLRPALCCRFHIPVLDFELFSWFPVFHWRS